jgi:mono/diheme cytochrome c family protein
MAKSGKSSRKWIVLFTLLVLLGAAGYVLWSRLLREEPLHYEAALDHFKYGSIGTEKEGLRVPFWIWLVLPRIFPEYLPGPGGYVSLGFAWEEGHELPIGLTKKVIGQPLVGINCALCHTATVRVTQYDKPTLYVGGPAHQFDTQGYFRFLFACASDPRFNADVILAELAPNVDLGFIDRLLYRYILIPQTKKGLLDFKQQLAWMDSRPDWGRGRIDPFNPAKFRYLELADDGTIGNSDMESVWDLRTRVDNRYVNHWDGLLHGTLQDVVVSSALGDSVTPKTLPLEDLKRVEEFLLDLPVPAYPFPIDAALAAQGEPLYQQHCADCHAVGGSRTGQVLPLAELGTDRHRLDMWTEAAVEAYNAYGTRYPWDFKGAFQKTDGYKNVLLDGIWLRAPYLHNGAAPSLADLLEPVANRPRVFWRGYDVYDPERVGFVSQGPDAERYGFRVDVTVAGNDNGGHLWGTELAPEEKRALVEYLKTL